MDEDTRNAIEDVLDGYSFVIRTLRIMEEDSRAEGKSTELSNAMIAMAERDIARLREVMQHG